MTQTGAVTEMSLVAATDAGMHALWNPSRFTGITRFCHRWNLSATWTACDAPVLALSNGGGTVALVADLLLNYL